MRELILVEPQADLMADMVLKTRAKTDGVIGVSGDSSLAGGVFTILEKEGVRADHLNSPLTEKVCGEPITGHLILVLTQCDGAALGKELHCLIDREDITIIAPFTSHASKNRPLFLISIPKSGTHMVHDLMRQMGFRAGVELPPFPDGQTWYCLEYSNSHTVARDFFVDSVKTAPFGNRHHAFMWSPSLFIYRHPLDILVSEAHYYGEDGKTTFAGWFSGKTFEERIELLLSDNKVIGSFSSRIRGFLPWLNFPNVISFSFEELVGGSGGGSETIQKQLVWSLLLKLQAPGNPDDVSSRIFNPDSPTFRAGQIGAYKTVLSEKFIDRFISTNAKMLREFGYKEDGTFGYSEKRRERLYRQLSFSGVDSYNTAIYLEKDFLGCDLIRYNGKNFGLPRTSDPITRLSPEQLELLPSDTSLVNLKFLLMFGEDTLAERRKELMELGYEISSRQHS